MTTISPDTLTAIVRGHHRDPFAVLGPHRAGKERIVRTFQPQAASVELLNTATGSATVMRQIHPDGVFEARLGNNHSSYRLRIAENGQTREIDDPYRFPSPLGDIDRYLMAEGTHQRLYDKLGSHVMNLDGVPGVYFAVWAPSAQRVSVVGNFNHWDGRRHPMRLHPANGIWDIFLPGLAAGELYKYEILGAHGQVLPLKTDPYARRAEPPPGNAAIVQQRDEQPWNDTQWMQERRAKATALQAPVAIYEVHLGSWKRREDEGNRYLSYRELADELVPYVKDMGYTHLELLPISEHPFDGSWGYQPIGMFAPTYRHGTPDDFKVFVEACHNAGIGLIIDWVPAHFPRDAHGLGEFDGTHLYEHADPRQGAHEDWGTLIFNFGRNEVVNYLLSNALFWIDEYHIDALRVDAVASMLYLDYSRKAGEWVPNQYGGRENLEAMAFMQRMNACVHRLGGHTMAEESTAWPMVSRPVYLGGLGYTYKWNMGWMHDTLGYMREAPIYRKYHHDRLTFSLVYAFSENFILPLSHDEVVHGKGSLLGKMPGDVWEQFANLRLYYTFMYGHPGKKLLFMGGEFGQGREWNYATGLEWQLLDIHWHSGVQRLVRDLNHLYQATPALYEQDCDPAGFEWIDCTDTEQSIIAFLRRANDLDDFVIVVCNFTPVVRHNYRIGAPIAGSYREVLNSDASHYGGSGVSNGAGVTAEAQPTHGRPYSLSLTLPPLAALILRPGIS